MYPKVSIIVPIYNVEKYLDKCLETLVNQTLKEIEIICVIDASPDQSIEICKKWQQKDGRIRLIDKKVNEGLGLTRNTGLNVAIGKYVAFIDSDDYVDTQMFEKLYKYAESHNLDVCFCDYQYDLGNGRVTKSREIKREIVKTYKNEVVEYMLDMIGPLPEWPSDVKYLVSVWHGIYSKEIIEKYNIRFESERKNASEDMPFHIDFLSKAEKLGYIPFPGYYYRYNPISLSRSYTHKKFEAYEYLFDEVKEKLGKICSEKQYMLHYQRFIFYFFRNIIKYEAVKDIDGQKFENIKLRCNDLRLKSIYKEYPYWRLPLKQRIFFFCMKHQIVWGLYAMCILENKIRKNV